MKIFLVQHGESLGKEIDPQQSLSPKGTTDIEHLGHFIAKKKIDILHLYHSGKRRAQQSAELLASSLKFSGTVELHHGIEPLDEVNPISEEIKQQNQNLMLVGHMPFLGKLIAHLIIQDENKSIVGFIPGTIVCLEKTDEGKWLINWVMRPD